MENKKKGRKKKRLYPQLRRAAALMFVCILAAICLINLITRDKTASEKENRKMTQKPKVTVSGLADGSFTEQYADYKSDQFAGRDFWVTVKSNAELVIGKREQRGIFKGKDSYLLEAIVKLDNEKLEKNLDAVKEFRASHSDVSFYFMLVPGAADVLSDKLPSLAVTENQTEQFEYIKEELGQSWQWVDARKALTARKKEEIYYHTDPRWTTLGAYYAYQELAEKMKLDSSKEPKLHSYAVTGDFSGILSAASGYEGGYREPVCIYSTADPEDNTKVVVDYVEEGRKTATLYDSSKLEGKDKYDVFFGGDFPIIDIRTAADSNERLLVIKDSHANCLVPFLVPYFQEIVMVDPAYFEGDTDQVIKDYEITSVLFLYGGNTFIEDTHISGVLTDDETE